MPQDDFVGDGFDKATACVFLTCFPALNNPENVLMKNTGGKVSMYPGEFKQTSPNWQLTWL